MIGKPRRIAMRIDRFAGRLNPGLVAIAVVLAAMVLLLWSARTLRHGEIAVLAPAPGVFVGPARFAPAL